MTYKKLLFFKPKKDALLDDILINPNNAYTSHYNLAPHDPSFLSNLNTYFELDYPSLLQFEKAVHNLPIDVFNDAYKIFLQIPNQNPNDKGSHYQCILFLSPYETDFMNINLSNFPFFSILAHAYFHKSKSFFKKPTWQFQINIIDLLNSPAFKSFNRDLRVVFKHPLLKFTKDSLFDYDAYDYDENNLLQLLDYANLKLDTNINLSNTLTSNRTVILFDSTLYFFSPFKNIIKNINEKDDNLDLEILDISKKISLDTTNEPIFWKEEFFNVAYCLYDNNLPYSNFNDLVSNDFINTNKQEPIKIPIWFNLSSSGPFITKYNEIYNDSIRNLKDDNNVLVNKSLYEDMLKIPLTSSLNIDTSNYLSLMYSIWQAMFNNLKWSLLNKPKNNQDLASFLNNNLNHIKNTSIKVVCSFNASYLVFVISSKLNLNNIFPFVFYYNAPVYLEKDLQKFNVFANISLKVSDLHNVYKYTMLFNYLVSLNKLYEYLIKNPYLLDNLKYLDDLIKSNNWTISTKNKETDTTTSNNEPIKLYFNDLTDLLANNYDSTNDVFALKFVLNKKDRNLSFPFNLKSLLTLNLQKIVSDYETQHNLNKTKLQEINNKLNNKKDEIITNTKDDETKQIRR